MRGFSCTVCGLVSNSKSVTTIYHIVIEDPWDTGGGFGQGWVVGEDKIKNVIVRFTSWEVMGLGEVGCGSDVDSRIMCNPACTRNMTNNNSKHNIQVFYIQQSLILILETILSTCDDQNQRSLKYRSHSRSISG